MITDKITPPPTTRFGWLWRILLEIAIIVLGVLLSLWISNGFQNRQDNDRARSYLQRLDKDLAKDEDRLKRRVEQRRTQLEQAGKLLQLISKPITPDAAPALSEGFQTLLWTSRFSASDATFRSLESTGDLRLIRQDSLVDRIVTLYRNQYDGLRENNEDVTKYRDNFLLPFVVENVSFRQAFAPKGEMKSFTQAQVGELFNHLVYERISLTSTVESYERTIGEVERLRADVKDALQ